MQHIRTVPILRSLDEAKAPEFYIGFPGFSIDWEHRFESETPLYMQVSRDEIVLHISEHHGDATPGSHIRVEIKGLRELHGELTAKKYKNNRPGLEHPEWGGLEMRVVDLCRNLITFAEREA